MTKDKKTKATSTNIPSVDEVLAEWESERHLTSVDRNSVYISTPITTGPLFVKWKRELGRHLENNEEYETSLKANVILPNVQRAASVLEVLRWHHTGLIINPTGLDVPGWEQTDYHEFWTKVLSRYSQRAIFLNGWEYSRGCTIEFLVAQKNGIDCVNEKLQPLDLNTAAGLMSEAIKEIEAVKGDSSAIRKSYLELMDLESVEDLDLNRLFKDKVLDHIACTSNVAQFVSFGPGAELKQHYCRISGYEPNHFFNTPEEAVKTLLENATEKKVNIRSYSPEKPEGNPFIKQLESVESVMRELRVLAGEKNLYTIVNEVIDESDNGVSGVCYQGLIEFAPDTTPRCVDDPDIETAVFPFELGMKILEAVYGFEPDLRGREGARVEFSIHPKPQGWKQKNTIIWQSQQRPGKVISNIGLWPNAFSRMLGDKTYGLLVANFFGFLVPRTVVFNRRLFPFIFGKSTGSNEIVTRTSPAVKEPGYYPSRRGWFDPYDVLEGRVLKPEARKTNSSYQPAPLNSVLIQEAVPAIYSGRAKYSYEENKLLVSGVSGQGEDFMVGEGDEELPLNIIGKVNITLNNIIKLIGPCSTEWVFDGRKIWILQLNIIEASKADYEETSDLKWVRYDYLNKNMLESFREKVHELIGTKSGVHVVGNVSPLSHLQEIAEKCNVPIKFTRF